MKTIAFFILSGLMIVGLSSVIRYGYTFQTGANSMNENRFDNSRTVAVIVPDEPWLGERHRKLLRQACTTLLPLPKIERRIP